MSQSLAGAALISVLLGVVLMLLYWFWRYAGSVPSRTPGELDDDPEYQAAEAAGKGFTRGLEWSVRATGWAGRALLLVAVLLGLAAVSAALFGN